MIPIDNQYFRSTLPEESWHELSHLTQKLQAHRPRNKVRQDFFDMQNLWRDMGVAIPARFKNLEATSGWANKAVTHLSRRIRMESFTTKDPAVLEDSGLDFLWSDNRMGVDLSAAITSALIHSPAFLLTMEGMEDLREPEVVVSAHDALNATGEWDWSRRALSSALVQLDTGGELEDQVNRFVFFHEDMAYQFFREKRAGRWTEDWSVDDQRYGLGRIPLEPLMYAPQTARPFGSSRITRAVMYITQAAIRTMVRAELGSEFYVTPQRYALNVSEQDVLKGKSSWDATISTMLTIAAAADPEDPEAKLGQFPQMTMTPHVDIMRMLSQLMSSETGIPVGSLGLVQDNPSSAEAIYAAKEDLVLEAEETMRGLTPAIVRTALNALQMRDGLAEVPDELKSLSVRWIDPSMPSRNQAADYVIKQVGAGILPAESDVTLEQLGYPADVIARLKEERRLEAARETVRQALAVNVGQTPTAPVPAAEPAGGVPPVGQFREAQNLPTQ